MYDYQEQFYQVMTRLRGSRVASTPPKDDAIVPEMINGILISKPARKVVDYVGETKEKNKAEPEIIDLQEYAKSKAAATVPQYQ
jgi:hypothetical protein